MVEVATALGGLEALAEAALISLKHRVELNEEGGQSAESVIGQLSAEALKKKT
jgi:hypothetical protein